MNIKMAGIDHRRASVEVRERFSLTQSALRRALAEAAAWEGVSGCVILSTCNRTELWLSGEGAAFAALCPVEALCRLKGCEPERYRAYFCRREGQEAVGYLMELAGGLKSQIFGDDQIITQVKQTLLTARKEGAADTALEVLFRTAVAGGKRVRSQMRLTNVDRSVASAAVELLRTELGGLTGRRCLVIGNGEMGRLTASELVRGGARVWMTLRQYKSGDAVIPAGCRVISYEERCGVLERMDAVVSATLSPHYTLTGPAAEAVLAHSGKVLVDLAIPRDIDPALGRVSGVRLFDMDSFASAEQGGSAEQLAQARAILQESAAEYLAWDSFRDWVPAVGEIAAAAGSDISARMTKPLRHLPPEQRQELHRAVEQAAAKTVAKLCFGLRDALSPEQMEGCMQALRQAAQEL